MQINKDSLKFLKEIGENNNREWFTENKLRYQKAQKNLIDFVEDLIEGISLFDDSIQNIDPAGCVFRIYRDVRFSKNKLPYKTNLGAHMLEGGRKGMHNKAGYYIHLENDNCFLGGGAYLPPPKWLSAIRESIDTDPVELRKVISSKNFVKTFGKLEGDQVKTAPRGFKKDHPDIDLLRYKSFTALRKVSSKELISKDFMQICLKAFKELYPFNEVLNKTSV